MDLPLLELSTSFTLLRMAFLVPHELLLVPVTGQSLGELLAKLHIPDVVPDEHRQQIPLLHSGGPNLVVPVIQKEIRTKKKGKSLISFSPTVPVANSRAV